MAVALSRPFSEAQNWRMRAAIMVDLAVGLATIPVLSFGMAQLNTLLGNIAPQAGQQVTWWSVLLMSAITLMLDGAAVALLARLAARGQTPGLAAVGLRWSDDAGRAVRWRLPGEPQLWCAALPALWVFLILPESAIRFFVTVASLDEALSSLFNLIGPILLAGALTIMGGE